jgi:hypothetical protein
LHFPYCLAYYWLIFRAVLRKHVARWAIGLDCLLAEDLSARGGNESWLLAACAEDDPGRSDAERGQSRLLAEAQAINSVGSLDIQSDTMMGSGRTIDAVHFRRPGAAQQ